MSKTCFIIFAHSTQHTIEDVDDMIDNINYFHTDSDFMILHPNMTHPKTRLNTPLGVLNKSSFIFGPLSKLIKDLTKEEINSFDHFCLVSANQYFINEIKFDLGVNYAQYYHKEDWGQKYNGKDTDKTVEGFPLQQPYGRWDAKDFYKAIELETTPMVANWECLTVTKEVMFLAQKYIDLCLEYYPNEDMINMFLPYMILKSGQDWEFPPFFGTYDPSNRPGVGLGFNNILTQQQIDEKLRDGYFSVKRVNYTKNCALKQYIRETLMTK